ncbi:MAG: acetyl-CoA carboxylase biotin carboxyl carrier protein [Saprospiraceae bacterium]|nr:acetyl-CoA carboxylase biotin carboxyl carrier protein [Saprospiraceae bacterium]
MNFKEIQELIRMVSKSDLTVFKLKDKDFELTIKTNKNGAPVVQHSIAPVISPVQAAYPTPVIQAVAASPTAKIENGDSPTNKNYLEIKSPMVGTFYRAPGPDKPPLIKVGDQIDLGSKVCIIEAMKLFNEIESEIKGTIVKVMVEDSTPVEYDQVLFLVEP